MREILNKLFPKDEEQKRTSKFVERGLEALRLVRDDHAVAMGTTRRVPSHFQLRVSPQHYDMLQGMDALRDMAFFFKDELMKDLNAEKMRTFGDHTVRVGIAADAALGANELYAVVLSPERAAEPRRRADRADSSANAAPPDATRILGQELPQDESPTVVFSGSDSAPDASAAAAEAPNGTEQWGWNLSLRFPDGTVREERLDGERWVVGRRGGTGALPAGFRKLDLDLPATISREQFSVELDRETLLLKNIGKAAVIFRDGTSLAANESRRLELDTPFFVEGIEVKIVVGG